MTTNTDPAPPAPAPKHASEMTPAQWRDARRRLAGGDTSVLVTPGRASSEPLPAMQMTAADYRQSRMDIRMGRFPAAKPDGGAA